MKVIHISGAPPGWKDNPDYVYIGRFSKWGNPSVLGQDGSRQQIIEKHRDNLLHGRLSHLLEDLEELRDKILVCHCKPAACHGDTYVELLNE